MKALLAGLLFGAALAAPAGASAQATESDGAIVQAYEPDPAVWLLQDEDTRIYLLGTVHVLPEGFRWRSPRIDGIVAEADELVLESTDEENPAEDSRIARALGSRAKLPGVSERLSAGNGDKWLALGESVGLDPETFDRLPPMLALLGMGISASQQETGAEREYGVETVLTGDFRAAGKPIGAIENATEVFLSLLTLDEAVLIKELDRELTRLGDKDPATMLFAAPAKPGLSGDSLLAVEHRWAQGGDVDLGPEAFGATTFGRSVDKALLARRNRAWAAWLEHRLTEPGTVLVAVGAGHLWGRNSLQVMLAGRGLAAERLN
jgi:uncharacterized protein YbaP (TraB family)